MSRLLHISSSIPTDRLYRWDFYSGKLLCVWCILRRWCYNETFFPCAVNCEITKRERKNQKKKINKGFVPNSILLYTIHTLRLLPFVVRRVTHGYSSQVLLPSSPKHSRENKGENREGKRERERERERENTNPSPTRTIRSSVFFVFSTSRLLTFTWARYTKITISRTEQGRLRVCV